jgi:hypothetical protein
MFQSRALLRGDGRTRTWMLVGAIEVLMSFFRERVVEGE